MSLWPFGKKKAEPLEPADIHPPHKAPQPMPSISNPVSATPSGKAITSAPAQPMAPPITPALSPKEIDELERMKFEQLKINLKQIDDLNNAGVAKYIYLTKKDGPKNAPVENKICPDELQRQTDEVNEILKKSFIDLKISYQEMLDSLLYRLNYELEKKTKCGLTPLQIAVYREAERRQLKKMNEDRRQLTFAEKREIHEKGCKEIYTEILAKGEQQRLRNQATNAVRFEKNLKANDPVKEEDIVAMIAKIKNHRTPVPYRANQKPDTKTESHPST